MKKRTTAPLGYMNPKVDFAFKLIFGNKDYPEITKSLLNSIITLPDGQQIVDVEIQNPNIDRRFKDDKYSIMDIHAITDNNILVNIEMQMINRDDMIPRTLFYMSKIIAGQLKSGKDYSSLKQTICINFVDFKLFNENNYVHNEFCYRTEKGELLTNLTQIHFIELPKAEKDGIIDNEMLKKWIQFLNNPSSKEVDMLVGEYSEIKKARNILSIANLKNKIRNMYYAREEAKLEKASWEGMKKRMIQKIKDEIMEQGIEEDRAEGLAQGIVQGMEKGLAEGTHSAKLEMARAMFLDGEPLEKIRRYTRLSVAELQELE